MDPEQVQISAADEFEKEMEEELETKVLEAETSGGIRHLRNEEIKRKSDFWDSDDENYLDEWEHKNKDKEDTEVNDDLFYDPNIDDEDQKWADDIRQKYQSPMTAKLQKNKEQKMPNSDAVLNCPACFIVLCLDCQRHEVYDSQYRAMFVMNCTVDYSQQLKYPKQSQQKKKGKKKQKTEESDNQQPQGVDPNDLFHPVKCDRCSTQVAVYDRDEIYHFFNVLASY